MKLIEMPKGEKIQRKEFLKLYTTANQIRCSLSHCVLGNDITTLQICY